MYSYCAVDRLGIVLLCAVGPMLQIDIGGVFSAQVGLRRSGANREFLSKMELGDVLKSHDTQNGRALCEKLYENANIDYCSDIVQILDVATLFRWIQEERSRD